MRNRKENYKSLLFPAVGVFVTLIVLSIIIFAKGPGAKVSANDLMKGISPNKVNSVELNEPFLKSTADFSVELFKHSLDREKNILVSPTSVYLALGMTANGADGNTLKEFETLLGKYGLTLKELNTFYNSLSRRLTKIESGKLSIANSIWYSQDKSLSINKDFLQMNADYYNSSAYKADFTSAQTVKDINNWVNFNTGKLIDKIIDKIDDRTVMYLINAVYFEDKWNKVYTKEDVREGSFKLADGTMKSVSFMYSQEETFIKDDKAQGFIKPYKNGRYSFVALLPNEEVSIDDYISSLSGESFIRLLKNKSVDKVSAGIPKFKSEYEVKLVEPLKQMGLKECFDDKHANFTRMGRSEEGNIYIGDVLHKTFITVDEQGTKAGAVTKVQMQTMSAPVIKRVILNRPFVYAVVDNETSLPLFIGAMMNPGA